MSGSHSLAGANASPPKVAPLPCRQRSRRAGGLGRPHRAGSFPAAPICPLDLARPAS